MTSRIETQDLLNALAAAFGSHSQVPGFVVGAAIFSHATVGAWPIVDVVIMIDECADTLDSLEDGDGISSRASIISGYRAAAERADVSHAPRI